MAKPDPVQLADPSADHARPARLAWIAITAGSCGVLLAFGLSRALQDSPAPSEPARATVASQRPEKAAHPTPESGSPVRSAAPARTLASTEVPPVSPAPPDARADVADDPATPHAATPQGATPPARNETDAQHAAAQTANAAPPARGAKRSFEPGVLAYVRCEGSEQTETRFPCPRDRKLENYVWHALAQLANCTVADPGVGSAELRLTLMKTRAVLSWKPPLSGPSLNLSALPPCAGEKLADARTRASLPQAVVSFRFSLE